jgi:hypothetical protein
LFYTLGYSRDECLTERIYVQDVNAYGNATYVTTALEPWLYGFWYRRKIEGTDQIVLAALGFIQSTLSRGDVGQIAPQGQPSNVPSYSTKVSSFWSHNGSIMGLSKIGDRRLFVYLKPRPPLTEFGINTDTIFFDGVTTNGREYLGIAKTFSKDCNPNQYKVAGTISDDDRQIVLEGKVPVRDAQCRETGFRDQRLVFDFLGSAATTSLAEIIASGAGENK